ncbi:MAG: ligase-associated DNA damage response endonuclease PdeM [Pseudomonadota bacterium]
MNKTATKAPPPPFARADGAGGGWAAGPGSAGALPFELNGEAVSADPSGVLWWPERRVLVAADLHFEKGTSYARKGLFLPPYDTRATLDRLEEAMGRLNPATVVSLGDAFHDRGAEARFCEEDAERLEALCRAVDWVWIAGNHDPAPPKRFRGMVCEHLQLGRLIFRHDPLEYEEPDQASGEVAGHLHPVAKVRRPGRSVRRRCFATDGRRLVMPAFGAYAGGLNLRDEAFAPLFSRDVAALMIGNGKVHRAPAREMLPD